MSIINLYENSETPEKFYFVGGVVRDELLKRESRDIDLVYEGNAIKFAKSSEYEIVEVNKEFGSVHLLVDDEVVDISSTRIEYYPQKGKLPVVKQIGCSIEDDVMRRDFTINALAKNCKTGKILDFVGGIKDLKKKKLRVLYEESFADDPTRIIRGLKFSVRFGFELDRVTKLLQDKYLENVNYDMSYKRLKDELIDAFSINKQKVLNKFINEKMYKLLSPEDYLPYSYDVEFFTRPYRDEIKNMWIIYLGGFDLSRLPLTKKEKKIISDFQEMRKLSGYELYQKFKKSSMESIMIYGLTTDYVTVRKYLKKWRKFTLHLTQKDLIAMGYKENKDIKAAFELLYEAKFKTSGLRIKAEIEIAKKYLDKIKSKA